MFYLEKNKSAKRKAKKSKEDATNVSVSKLQVLARESKIGFSLRKKQIFQFDRSEMSFFWVYEILIWIPVRKKNLICIHNK